MGLLELYRRVNEPPPPPEYMPATRRSRLRFLALITCMAPVYFGVGPATQWALERGASVSDLCDQRVWLRGLLLAYLVLVLLFVAFLVWQGTRIWILQQVPLPDAPLLFRRQLKRGFWARFDAALLFAFAAAVIAVVAYVASTDAVVGLFSDVCVRGDPPVPHFHR